MRESDIAFCFCRCDEFLEKRVYVRRYGDKMDMEI
jgi:hypothetical protein